MKFLFLSRHALTPAQIEDLRQKGFDRFEHVNPGVITVETAPAEISRLAAEHCAQAVGLVAPGRVWMALAQNWAELSFSYKPGLYEAESRQGERIGDGPIPFVHVAWHLVVPGVRPCQCGSGRDWANCPARTPFCG